MYPILVPYIIQHMTQTYPYLYVFFRFLFRFFFEFLSLGSFEPLSPDDSNIWPCCCSPFVEFLYLCIKSIETIFYKKCNLFFSWLSQSPQYQTDLTITIFSQTVIKIRKTIMSRYIFKVIKNKSKSIPPYHEHYIMNTIFIISSPQLSI